mgnify:CR=1 FL=1
MSGNTALQALIALLGQPRQAQPSLAASPQPRHTSQKYETKPNPRRPRPPAHRHRKTKPSQRLTIAAITPRATHENTERTHPQPAAAGSGAAACQGT